jgi:plastocyanin
MNESALPEIFKRKTKILFSQSTWIPSSLRWMFLFTVLIVPQVLWGVASASATTPQTWFATVGAQSRDKGRQALAFLPNEIWIHVNDFITWTIDVDEPHTITFLTDGETRPPFTAAPSSPPPVTFNGSNAVSSTGDPTSIANGNTFTVQFTKAGDFKLVCLFHNNMTGVVHVLDATQTPVLPHDQAFYNRQADDQRRDLLSDRDGRSVAAGHQHDECTAHDSLKARVVTAGIGEISATAGGTQTLSVMRFIDGNIQIRVGDTVEWTNQDPVTPHTVTFGTEPDPADLPVPSANVHPDAEGVPHASISLGDSVNSGFLVATLQDQTGNPQTPLGSTRFRITFLSPGVFTYICGLHDILGMTGTVTVR